MQYMLQCYSIPSPSSCQYLPVSASSCKILLVPVNSCLFLTVHVKLCQALPSPSKRGQVLANKLPSPVKPSQVLPSPSKPCQVLPSPAKPMPNACQAPALYGSSTCVNFYPNWQLAAQKMKRCDPVCDSILTQSHSPQIFS